MVAVIVAVIAVNSPNSILFGLSVLLLLLLFCRLRSDEFARGKLAK